MGITLLLLLVEIHHTGLLQGDVAVISDSCCLAASLSDVLASLCRRLICVIMHVQCACCLALCKAESRLSISDNKYTA